MNILVTGGLGYIGSHTVVELLHQNYNVVVVDDLSNSKLDVIEKIRELTGKEFTFYKIDAKDKEALREVFTNHKFDAVIHFAGFKAVGESVAKPLMYYHNNLLTTIVVSELCLEYDVNKFVFSSSATVYGDNVIPYEESMSLLPTTNPYGETKAMCERILKDTASVNEKFHISLLRYFNPIGAHESGLLVEEPNGIPNNLMPYIVQVASGKREKLYVYGDDYDTVDGTGVRDYVHVVDLAKGHVLALKNMDESVSIYNLGTGVGFSVLQVVNTFKEVNNIDIPFDIVDRRPGDLAIYYANSEKAYKELGFETQYSLGDMCKHAYEAVKKNS